MKAVHANVQMQAVQIFTTQMFNCVAQTGISAEYTNVKSERSFAQKRNSKLFEVCTVKSESHL